MTKASRNKGLFTDFSEWIRNNQRLSSENGYILTDIDYLWKNYNNGRFMILEEKTHFSDMDDTQRGLIYDLNLLLKRSQNYHGFHLIQFENTCPSNGDIYIDKKKSSEIELVELMQMLDLSKPEIPKINRPITIKRKRKGQKTLDPNIFTGNDKS